MVGSAGGDWKEYRAIKIDIHQTLVKAHHSPDLSDPEPGAIDTIKHWINDQGCYIWLSCGGFRSGDGTAAYKEKVRRWLSRYGIDPDKNVGFQADQKYILDISDRAIEYTDWKTARQEGDRRLNDLLRSHDPDPS